MVRFPRPIRWLVNAVIIVAVGFVIFDPAARPGWRIVAIGSTIAVVGGLLAGAAYRQSTTREERLRHLHSLSPRLGRRLFPPPEGDDRDGTPTEMRF